MELCGFDKALILQFADELRVSHQPSVDAFLEQHKKNNDYERLGKAAIAASLIRYEDTPGIWDRSRQKLYEYIWHRASATPGTYGGNALSILTFNYDRSFEEFLRTALCASHPEFRDMGDRLQTAVESFPVLHLYGSLGSLDKRHQSYLKYGGEDNPAQPETILAAAERIKLFHQAQFDQQSVDSIRDCITQAEKICFLGFGFHPLNVKILHFCGLGENSETTHYASAFDLKRGERDVAVKALKLEIEFAAETAKCLDALRHFPVLVAS
jgi:hypothetical protein